MSSKRAFVSLIVLCLLIVATARPARATTIAGGTVSNQTWTPAGSPYLIQGDIVVPAGASLTIQAGTVVQVAAGDATAGGLDGSRVEIHVAGTLTVNGTASKGVSFASASSSAANAWYGIVVDSGATSANIAHATIKNAQTGLTTSGTAGATIDSTLITGCGTALELDGSGTTTVQRSTISNNAAGIASFGESVSIIDSLVTYNNSYGVNGGGGSVRVTYSDVFGNSPNYVGLAGRGNYSFEYNPLYVSAPDNLRLTGNSPARNVSSTGGDLGALPYTSDATPELVGVLWQDTTLTLAGSPYTLLGDLEVPAGVTLTIEPGVVIQFAKEQDMMGGGISAEQGELRVRGPLRAAGTSAQPITLTSTGTGRSQWFGVLFLPGAATPTFSHVNISEGTSGIQIGIGDNRSPSDYLAPPVTLPLDHVTVTSTTYGMDFASGNIVLDTARFEDCQYAFSSIYSSSYDGPNVTLRNVVFTGNGTALDHHSWGTTVVTSSTIDGNFYGLNTWGYNVTLSNSIVTNNTIGISGGSLPFSVLYSDVWGNDTDYSAASPGEGCISADPKYVSSTDLHLQATSACIDSGDAGGSAPNHDYDGVIRPLDGDGNGSAAYDMGAYEFVASPICGDTVALGGEVCDDGYLNGTYGHCKADCSGMGPFCGDGTKNGNEECDDGNSVRGDGCTPACKLEPPSGEGGMTGGPGSAGDAGSSAEAGASTNPAQGGRGGSGHAGRGSGATTGDGGQSDAQAGADSNPEAGGGPSSGGSAGRGGAGKGGNAGKSAADHSGAAGSGARPPSTGGGDHHGGCGCRVAERKGSTQVAPYLLFGLVLAWRKRRRSLDRVARGQRPRVRQGLGEPGDSTGIRRTPFDPQAARDHTR